MIKAKVKLLVTLKDKAEIIIAISAEDLARNKIRADYGIGYDADVMRLIDNTRELAFYSYFFNLFYVNFKLFLIISAIKNYT